MRALRRRAEEIDADELERVAFVAGTPYARLGRHASYRRGRGPEPYFARLTPGEAPQQT